MLNHFQVITFVMYITKLFIDTHTRQQQQFYIEQKVKHTSNIRKKTKSTAATFKMSTKEATFRASDHSPRTHMAGKRVYLLACRNDNSFSVCALNRSGANKCGKNCVWRVCVRYQRASMCSIERKNDEEKDVCLCLANGLTARQNLQQSMLWFCRFQIAPCNACIFIFFCAILASVRCLFLMTFFFVHFIFNEEKKMLFLLSSFCLNWFSSVSFRITCVCCWYTDGCFDSDK